MQRILIRHLSGARAGQLDEFPAAETSEILVGRDPEATVRFDPSREDLVSRQHVKIVRDPEGDDEFALVDLQSRNGTFLNRQRIYAPARLTHNDVVQLGPAGPEFRFEFDPPPFPTRQLEHTASIALLPSSYEDSSPRPIGRATVERMLGDTFVKVKHESDKAVWVGAAALTAILVVGGITYVYMRQNAVDATLQAQQNQQMIQQMGQDVRKAPEAAEAIRVEVQSLDDQLKISEQRNAETLRKLSQQVAEQEAVTKEAVRDLANREQSLPAQSAIPASADIPSSTAVAEPVRDPNQKSDYDGEVRTGVNMLANGDADGALRVAQHLMQTQPNRWEAYSIAGSVAKLQSRPSQAKSMFEKALSLAPEEVKPSLQQALTEIAKGGQ